jgi:hypothetical protein
MLPGLAEGVASRVACDQAALGTLDFA